MKKKFLLLLTVTLTALPAFADLGDTYAQSCRKYGGSGEVDQKTRTITWRVSRHYVVQTFCKNRCVIMRLIPGDGTSYQADDMVNILPYESQKQWIHIGGNDGKYVGSWATADGSVLASVYSNGTCQVAYKWFIARKGLLDHLPSNGYGDAPVEDDGNSNGDQM